MKPLPFKAELKPEDCCAIIDTREQLPLDLSPLKVEAGSLTTGDYSVKGLEQVVAIERKSAVDMLACIGRNFQGKSLRTLASNSSITSRPASICEFASGEFAFSISLMPVTSQIFLYNGTSA
jgi:hypothetical protein